jgi:hypothetical protein
MFSANAVRYLQLQSLGNSIPGNIIPEEQPVSLFTRYGRPAAFHARKQRTLDPAADHLDTHWPRLKIRVPRPDPELPQEEVCLCVFGWGNPRAKSDIGMGCNPVLQHYTMQSKPAPLAQCACLHHVCCCLSIRCVCSALDGISDSPHNMKLVFVCSRADQLPCVWWLLAAICPQECSRDGACGWQWPSAPATSTATATGCIW